MQAQSWTGIRVALLSLPLLQAAALAGENPTGTAPLVPASATAPIASAWAAAVIALLALLGAAILSIQAVRRNAAPPATAPDPAVQALSRKVDRLQGQLDRLHRELAALPRPAPEPVAPAPAPAPAPEPAPAPSSREPAPQPEPEPPSHASPQRLVDSLLEQTLPSADGQRLQGFLAALLTVPEELHEAFRGSPDQAAERIESRHEALDQALYERWPADDLQAACEGAEDLDITDWESLAGWVRKQQEQAIEELAGHGLRRFAPPPMALLSPDTAVPSDEPPQVTSNPDLRDRVAGVTPGNGGWRIGQQVICRARARLYEYRAEGEA